MLVIEYFVLLWMSGLVTGDFCSILVHSLNFRIGRRGNYSSPEWHSLI